MSYPQLRARSAYTLAQGASAVKEMVARAKVLGIPALALTDHENLFGTLEFSKECMSSGVQPVMGVRARLLNARGRGGFLTFLATTEIGFANLCRMVKAIGLPPDGTPERKLAKDVTRLPRDVAAACGEDVICLWGGAPDGSMWKLPASDLDEELAFLSGIFGNRLYAEICRVPGERTASDVAAEAALLDFAWRKDLPVVGTCDTWYAEPRRHSAWVLLAAMSAEPRREVLFSDDGMVDAGEPVHGLPSAGEMEAMFEDLPEALNNAVEVARRCAFGVKGRPPMLPPFACGEGRTEDQELARQSHEGLKVRMDRKSVPEGERKVYDERLDFEIGVITRMGFPGYFLIVADFIGWAKRNGIPVGPGRGSGAGSVVAWALGITDLDPLEFGLLFERFLNPDRVSMPDFDIDFCEDRRDEVIRYVRAKYGEANVAYIATFGIIRGKTALRDTHRVVRHDKLGAASLKEMDYVSKLIPKREEEAQPMGLMEAHEKVTEFREAVSAARSPTVAMVFELAREVEGLMKSRGQHAAGVVISDRPLETLVPVMTDEASGATVTGYSQKGVEEAGLVKFDFLGLTTLSILEEARRHVMTTRGFDLDLSVIPRDDPRVMTDLAKGDSTGVFQFETGGMRKTLRQVKPTRLEDLIAVVALFRPGPMAFIETYADRKNGKIETEYPQPREKTEPFLGETYGIMVYQEQVMQVAQACAGYSLGEADLLRRAMGKKIAAEMTVQKDIFIKGSMAGFVEAEMTDGSRWHIHAFLKMRVRGDDSRRMTLSELVKANLAPNETDFTMAAQQVKAASNSNEETVNVVSVSVLNNGMESKVADDLFDSIASFANYGFNKSHAAAYAWIGYQTAWVRHHFPVEFYAALMTYCRKPEKRGMVKDDMTRHGIDLLPPDINHSFARFAPEMDGGILCVRYGFCGIKGLPSDLSWLEREREANGPFQSLKDFHDRARKRLNKDQMQVLAAMGGFSSLVPVRAQAADILRKLEGTDGRTGDLFGGADVTSDVGEWPNVPEREFSSAGFYMSGHPLDTSLERLAMAPVQSRNWWRDKMLAMGEARTEGRLICVLVRDIQRKQTKNGSGFLQVRVDDREDTFQMNCFSRDDDDLRELYEELARAKSTNASVIVDCDLSLSADGEQVWVNGNAAISLTEYVQEMDTSTDVVLIRLSPPSDRPVEVHVEDAARMAARVMAHARHDDNPERTVAFEVACAGTRVRLPGRYNFSEAKPLVQVSVTGVLKVTYLAGHDAV